MNCSVSNRPLFMAATFVFVLWKSECILFQLSHMNSEIGLNAQFHQMDQSCLLSASHPSLDALSGAMRRQTDHQCQGQRDKVCFLRNLLKCRCMALSHGKWNISNFLVLQEIKITNEDSQLLFLYSGEIKCLFLSV